MRAIELALAVCGHQQHGGIGETPEQVAEQPQCGAVGPVQVVDVEQQAATPGKRTEERGHGVEKQEPLLVCGQIDVRRRRTDAVEKLRRELGDLPDAVAGRGAERFGIGLRAHPPTQRFGKRQVRRRGLELVARAPEDEGAIEARLDHELAREPRLADAGLAAQEHAVTPPLPRALPELARMRQLFTPAHHAAARQRIQHRE